ncbi:hypothetical protein [Coralloluteibacterium thermophilus]|uniref:YtxH domain-containing protein n=1 Tax=Coralloluteibacterium thermophilum TaxID=2707049 RepID=A0ABV9NLL6_9GAMM
MADNDTGSSAARSRATSKRSARPAAKRAGRTAASRGNGDASGGKAVTRASGTGTRAGVSRKTLQTAAIVAVSAAAAAGAVYALRRSGVFDGGGRSLASLNADVKRITADTVKALVERGEDMADHAGRLASKAEKKGRRLLAR